MERTFENNLLGIHKQLKAQKALKPPQAVAIKQVSAAWYKEW